jgi:hypothetical protein
LPKCEETLQSRAAHFRKRNELLIINDLENVIAMKSTCCKKYKMEL